jgi:hypothetical protein
MSQKSRVVETHRYTYNYRPGPLFFDGLFIGPQGLPYVNRLGNYDTAGDGPSSISSIWISGSEPGIKRKALTFTYNESLLLCCWAIDVEAKY